MSDENDDELWELNTRDVDKIERAPSAVPASSQKEPQKPPKAAPAKEKPAQPVLPRQQASSGLDRKTADKLRKGQMQLEGRLDLHGMTQIEAHTALNSFITASYIAGKRCVLVITGKGLGADGRRDPLSQGQGVLKRMVPEWLGEQPLVGVILKAERAQPQHGGDGALYVLLRRQR